jgi:hypothetical protein
VGRLTLEAEHHKDKGILLVGAGEAATGRPVELGPGSGPGLPSRRRLW